MFSPENQRTTLSHCVDKTVSRNWIQSNAVTIIDLIFSRILSSDKLVYGLTGWYSLVETSSMSGQFECCMLSEEEFEEMLFPSRWVWSAIKLQMAWDSLQIQLQPCIIISDIIKRNDGRFVWYEN